MSWLTAEHHLAELAGAARVVCAGVVVRAASTYEEWEAVR